MPLRSHRATTTPRAALIITAALTHTAIANSPAASPANPPTNTAPASNAPHPGPPVEGPPITVLSRTQVATPSSKQFCSITNLAVHGDILCAAGDCGLHLIDVADPKQAKLVGHVPYSVKGDPRVVVRGDTAFVASALGLTVVDIANPHEPHVVTELPFADTGKLYEVHIDGDLLAAIAIRYVNPGLTSHASLVLVDVANPAAPKVLSKTPIASAASSVRLARGHAFLTQGPFDTTQLSGLYIYDLATPATPKLVGTLPVKGMCWLAFDDGRAILASQKEGVIVADVSDLTAPKRISTLPLPSYSKPEFPWPPNAIWLATSNGLATIATLNQGLIAVDVSHPQKPVLLGRWSQPSPSVTGFSVDVQCVTIDGRVAYAIIEVNEPKSGALDVPAVALDISPWLDAVNRNRSGAGAGGSGTGH